MQMPSGLPARVAVVCTLVFGVAIAHAERRPVAVIDLSADPKTEQLAKDLNPVLLGHPDLQPIPDPSVAAELFGLFRDDDQDAIANANNSKETAEGQLGQYSFETANESAGNGLAELQKVVPSPAVIVLYAKLSLLRGQALLGMPRQASEAPISFALAHRFDPSFVPYAGRYLPDIIDAYEAAKKRWTGKGTLGVVGRGRLWIDGKDSGLAPADVEVDAGPHVVWLTGPDRVTSAKQILVEAGKVAKLEIDDVPASKRLKVRRARAALRYAPDPAARAAAMRVLADLVEVRDAVLLSIANGKVIVQTWNAGTREQAPGFSALRELKNEKPIELLAPLAPPAPQVDKPKPDEPKPKPIVDNRRWIERRSVQVSIAVGVVAAIIGGYYIYKAATDDDFLVDNDLAPARIRW